MGLIPLNIGYLVYTTETAGMCTSSTQCYKRTLQALEPKKCYLEKTPSLKRDVTSGLNLKT